MPIFDETQLALRDSVRRMVADHVAPIAQSCDESEEFPRYLVPIFGGDGYIRDNHVERMMRDAKILQICEGTNQIQRVVIARRALGLQ